jgi:tetratricopeptide (TPR) repeat protein
VRDPKRAIELAQGLCDEMEQNPDFRYSLAVAYLSDGNWKDALREATLAVQLRASPNPFDLFALAIAEHHRGNVEAATQSFAKAEQLMLAQCPGRIELIAWRKRAKSLFEPAETEDADTQSAL